MLCRTTRLQGGGDVTAAYQRWSLLLCTAKATNALPPTQSHANGRLGSGSLSIAHLLCASAVQPLPPYEGGLYAFLGSSLVLAGSPHAAERSPGRPARTRGDHHYRENRHGQRRNRTSAT